MVIDMATNTVELFSASAKHVKVLSAVSKYIEREFPTDNSIVCTIYAATSHNAIYHMFTLYYKSSVSTATDSCVKHYNNIKAILENNHTFKYYVDYREILDNTSINTTIGSYNLIRIIKYDGIEAIHYNVNTSATAVSL